MQAPIRTKKSHPNNDLRRPDGAAPGTPNLVFAGEHLTCVDLRVLARELRLEPRGARAVARVLDLIDDDTVAVLLACPLVDNDELADACSDVRAALAEHEQVIPIFATTRDAAQIAELARLDVTGTFVWPAQRDALVDALSTLLEPRSEGDLATRERLVVSIAKAFDDTPPSVAIEVDDERRVVTLAGNVASHDELQRVVDVVGDSAYGYSVDNFLTIAPDQRDRDSTAAARIEFAIAKVMPDADVDVSVIGGRAVVSGHVDDEQRRDTLRALVKAQSDVDRVINHVNDTEQ